MRLDFPVLLLAMTVAAIAQPNPPAQQQTKPDTSEKALGSIEGKVVDASSGEPVTKATLRLTSMPAGAGVAMAGPLPSSTATTDAEGKFSFTALEAGIYMLLGERTGYVRQQYGSRNGQMGRGTPLTLKAGEKLIGLDFRLLRQAVITGRVTDEEGEPVQNAGVVVLQPSPLSPQPMGMQMAQTNDLGEFRIANLPPGRYLVRVDGRFASLAAQAASSAAAPPEGVLRPVPTYYPAAIEPQTASPIALAAGQVATGIDIRLAKSRTFQISGKVVGLPAGARVQISVTRARSANDGLNFGGSGGQAKADGSFVAASIQPGPYWVVAMQFDTGRPVLIGRAEANVSNTNVENIVIEARKPLELAGRITIEGDDALKPSGQIMLSSPDRLPIMMEPARVQEDGTFKFPQVPRDKVTPFLMGIPPNTYIKSVELGGADVMETGLDLAAADASSTLEIRLSTKGSVVEGAAMDAEGKPASGATLMLLPYPLRPGHPTTSFYRRTASTDQNGGFSIKGVAPGEYRLYAWDSAIQVSGDLTPEVLKPYDKNAVTVKAKEGSQERVEVKVSQIQVE